MIPILSTIIFTLENTILFKLQMCEQSDLAEEHIFHRF